MTTIALSGIFLSVLAAVFGLGYWYWARDESEAVAGAVALRAGRRPVSADAPQWASKLSEIGDAVKLGEEDEGELRRTFHAAGFRQSWAEGVYYGARVAGLFGLPALCIVLIAFGSQDWSSIWLLCPLAGAIGYLAPEQFLKRRIRSRRESINRSLPDFLDLLVISIESGLALDSAIGGTARDLRRSHPVLADEVSAFGREILAGVTRAEALENLGTRTGEKELKKLTALLVQADRFGSSVSKLLRTQARYMRIQRRQSAEEKAHKVGVKILFPIFFLIMPAIFLVVAGPAVIMMLAGLSRMAGGN